MPLVILTIFGVAAAIFKEWQLLRKHENAFENSIRPYDDFLDLRGWIIEHMDDCSMSDTEWEGLLPICRFADDRMRASHGCRFKPEYCCEKLVLEILNDEEEPENTPS